MKLRERLLHGAAQAVLPMEDLPPVLARHVSRCLACQAEQARYRTQERLLGSWRPADGPGAPSDLVTASMTRLHEPKPRRRSWAMVALLGVVGAVAALFGWRRLTGPGANT